MRSISRVLGASALGITMTATGLAFGGDTTAAELLFKRGLEAMNHSQFKEACDAFAGSDEADPSPGTEINLALCSEKQGKLATAWGWYRTAAGLANRRGQKERAELARGEEAKLEPKLHKLTVNVRFPAEGLAVTRNGQSLPNALLGTEAPIDPGDYVIEVNAKGKKPWKQTIHIAASPGVDNVDVPALEDAPVEARAAGPGGSDYAAPAPTRDGGTQRIIGFVMGGAGIVAGVVAVVYEVTALKEDKARQDGENSAAAAPTSDAKATFTASAASHGKAAKTDQAVALVTGIGGVVLVGVGIALVLTAPSSKASAGVPRPLLVPLLGRDNAGLGLVGTF